MSGAVAPPAHARAAGAALRLLGDDRLARRAAEGDREAFAVLYRRHHQALYRYCRAILGNGEDAEDALQGTMAAALRALPGERRQIKVKPWLYRIAHNESVSLLRRRVPHAGLEAAVHVAAPRGSDPETKERLRHLVADMRELPDRQRAALVMRELNGLNYDEIAATLESSPGATKQLVYEARTALHEMAEGRDMSCDSVRRLMSAEDRRVLRGRKLRAHLKECAGCREFKQVMEVRRRDFAAMAPPLPALAAAALLQGLGGGGHGGGALAGLVGGAAGKAAATSALIKGATTVAVIATVGAGAAGVTGNLPVALDHKDAPREAPATDGTYTAVPGTQRPNRRVAGGANRNAGARGRRDGTKARGPRETPGSRRARIRRGSRPAVTRQRPAPRRPARRQPPGGRRDAVPGDDKTHPSTPAAPVSRLPAKPDTRPAKTPGASTDLETP